jgi:hypothetical protein
VPKVKHQAANERSEGAAMKRIVVLAALLLGVAFTALPASASGPPPVTLPQLGGGFNGYLGDINNSLILKSGVKWARAYIDVQRNFLTFSGCPGPQCSVGVLASNIVDTEVYAKTDPDTVSPVDDVLAVYAVKKLVAAKSVGCQPPVDGSCPPFNLILSLKLDFDYKNAGIPEPNSQYEKAIFDAVTLFLTYNDLGSQIDILVLGNEPMFETPLGNTPQASALAAAKYATFLTRFIAMLHGLQSNHSPYIDLWDFKIFTGSLDRPYSYVSSSASNRSRNTFGPIIQSIIDITAKNPNVAGIDLHEHVASIKDAANDVDYVNAQFALAGANRQIISTEFSMVLLWDSVLNAGPGVTLCNQVNQMIKSAAAGTPVTFAEFQSYLSAKSWYPKTQNGLGWFAQFYCMFHRRPNVATVIYGLERTPRYPYTLDLLQTDSSNPPVCRKGQHSWVMMPAFDGATMGTDRNGASAGFGYLNANPLVFPEFAKVLNDPAKTCADLFPPPP